MFTANRNNFSEIQGLTHNQGNMFYKYVEGHGYTLGISRDMAKMPLKNYSSFVLRNVLERSLKNRKTF